MKGRTYSVYKGEVGGKIVYIGTTIQVGLLKQIGAIDNQVQAVIKKFDKT